MAGSLANPAGSVALRVRAAWTGIALLRAAECAVLGSAAFAITLAASVASGGEADSRAASIVGAIAGACAGAAWWIERRPDRARVARSLDRVQHLAGALVTAFETEAEASGSPIARLLAARVSRDVRPARQVLASVSASSALLAAPFLGAALLGLALEARRAAAAELTVESGQTRRDLAARSAQVAARARALVAASADKPQIAAIARQAEALASQAATASGRDASLPERVRALEDRVAGLELAVGVAPGGAEGTMIGPTGSSDADSNPSRAPTVQAHPPAGPATSTVAGAEAGLVAGRWWAARYDAVVERWVEAERAARASAHR